MFSKFFIERPVFANVIALVTILIGVVGAFVGGFIGSLVGMGDISGFDIRSFFLAVGGAVLLLLAYRFFQGKRAV